MQTIKVDTTSKKDVNRWVDFPYHLYENHPYYVPMLKGGVRKLLDKTSHPFYEHSDADFFIAEKNSEVQARICVMENRHYNEHQNEKAAFFGYFDCAENIEAARAVFRAACEWAAARGLETVYGPKGLLGAAAGGQLVEGFDLRAALDITYNYPYYDAYIKDSGFEQHRDLLSGYIQRTGEDNIPDRVRRIAERMAERGGFWARRFKTKNELRALVPQIGEMHRRAFVETPNYYPMTDAEFEMMAEELIMVADPKLITLVMKEDEIIGFVFTYPDISGGLQKAKGSLFPFGWWHILQARKKNRWVIMNGVGILPEYQGRGANAVLYLEIARTILQSQYHRAELVQVGLENKRSMADQLTFGVEWTKTHRVYKKTLQR
ncbi:MAG TPA: GNAT family N-acetyltransferase [Anaerolineales bacterium]|nr:GNAT family N-acetyltransferase [Anaerolineales bacterium]